eukprot:664615_1
MSSFCNHLNTLLSQDQDLRSQAISTLPDDIAQIHLILNGDSNKGLNPENIHKRVLSHVSQGFHDQHLAPNIGSVLKNEGKEQYIGSDAFKTLLMIQNKKLLQKNQMFRRKTHISLPNNKKSLLQALQKNPPRKMWS